MKRVRTAVLAIALSGALSGALAGCGDDGDDPEDAVTVTATVTPTPTEVSPEPTPPTEPTEPTEATEPTEPTESVAPTEPPVDGSQPPTTYAEAEAHIAAATAAPQQLGRFRSGDDKFYCTFNDEFIPPSCEILDAVQDPETCAGSPSSGVGRMELTRRGWAPLCNTDTVRQPGAKAIAQGAVVTWPAASIECVLEGFGLTCLSTDDAQGFFIGPGRYYLF